VQQVLRTAHCRSSAHKAAQFGSILHRAQFVASPALGHAKARYALALVAQLALIHQQLLDDDRAIAELFRQPAG
jgi:hypothetical protein